MEPLHPILAGMGSVFSVKGLYILKAEKMDVVYNFVYSNEPIICSELKLITQDLWTAIN
jgi:hypothetical protein